MKMLTLRKRFGRLAPLIIFPWSLIYETESPRLSPTRSDGILPLSGKKAYFYRINQSALSGNRRKQTRCNGIHQSKRTFQRRPPVIQPQLV